MRIRSLHFKDAGPLGTQIIDLTDDWDGGIENQVLFTGPNGCGKSTVLRAVAMLWEAFGYWLDHGKVMPAKHPAKSCMQNWGGVGMILEYGVDNDKKCSGLVFGEQDWANDLLNAHGCRDWVGEMHHINPRTKRPRSMFIADQACFDMWAKHRQAMILTFEKALVPNIVYLDAEERRWVTPKRNIGEHIPDQSTQRWLTRYQATDDWKGQLESSLLNLKVTRPQQFNAVVRDLNMFLADKEIETKVYSGENRLRVRITGERGKHHSLDELSAGEHQVLILVYLISRWSEQGCVVMIDEPDLYLHPSLVNSLLANLEQMVKERKGQLLITSHAPDLWRRYENKGKRLELRAAQ